MSPLPLTGIDARWLLSFQREDARGAPDTSVRAVDIDSEQYRGEIQATLPGGLEAGAYRFVVHGMSDADYAKINLAGERRLRVTLYLFWGDDTGAGALRGYAQNLLGIAGTGARDSLGGQGRVAVLAVTRVERTAGELTYDVVITARERIFDVVARAAVCGAAITGTTFGQLLDGLLHDRVNLTPGTDFEYHPVDHDLTRRGAIRVGGSALDLLVRLESKLEDACPDKHGRGMYLQRDGVLHVGPRPIPLGGSAPIVLDEAGGLLGAPQQTGRVQIDPRYALCGDDGSAAPPAPTRRQFKLTSRGRADVKPGDLVRFTVQPEDDSRTEGAGIVGAVQDLIGPGPASSASSGETVVVYVESVDHRLSPADGFRSSITGSEVASADRPWDSHTTTTPGAPRPQVERTAATPEVRVADAITRAVRRLAGEASSLDVGEIRAVDREGDTAQTLAVWLGLAAGQNDADPGQARRLDVERPSRAAHEGVPYLTPFAWGPCGLVLPNYPGSRVVVDDRNGMPDDPIALGALWQSDHAPTSAEPGDFWLILPVGVEHRDRVDDDWTPSDFAGKATNDLIDGDGGRVIEAKTLAIDTGDLQDAGHRPDPIDDGVALRLRFKSDGHNASLTIKTDGSIEIESSTDITIKARNLNVKVSGKMDVSQSS